MYSANFDYVRAGSVAEALALYNQHANARFLAGGHSLIPILKLRLDNPDVLIDIGRIAELKGITVSNGMVRIGALTTHAEIATSQAVPAGLRDAAGQVGDRQVRHRGTIGGNVAHADPASDLPTILTALGATFHLTSSGGARVVAAKDFFKGLFETAKTKDEMLVAVEVPVEVPTGGASAYTKLANPASGYCMVGAAVSLTVADGKCASISIAMGGLTNGPVRCAAVEAALTGKALDGDSLAAAASQVTQDLPANLMGDLHASADYRKAMASVYLKRALQKAVGRA